MLKEYLTLPFLANFRCICCGKCCKNNWAILVDKHTKDKFDKAEKSSNLLVRAKDAFIEVPERKGLFSEHLLKIHPERGCNFLDDTNQCIAHKELGHDFIPIICQIYPRLIYLTDRGRELALKMSCPAVLDICADYDGELRIEKYCIENNTEDKLCATNHLKSLNASSQMHRKYYFLIEEFLIRVLDRENSSASQKLYLIGLFIEKLLGELDNKKNIKIEQENIISCFNNISSATPNENYRSEESKVLELFVLKNFFDKAVITKKGSLNEAVRSVRDYFCTLGFDGINNTWFVEKELEICFQVFERMPSFSEGWDLSSQKDFVDILIRNCLGNFVFNKYFYFYNLIEAYIILSLFFCNIRLYATAFAHLRKIQVDVELVKEVVCFVFSELYNNESFLKEFISKYMELCNNDISKSFELAYSFL